MEARMNGVEWLMGGSDAFDYGRANELLCAKRIFSSFIRLIRFYVSTFSFAVFLVFFFPLAMCHMISYIRLPLTTRVKIRREKPLDHR